MGELIRQSSDLSFNANILIKEEDGLFVAHCLELDIVAVAKRGKGSEVILLKPDPPGSKQGPQIPIKCHSNSTEIYIPVVNAVLRRFGIKAEEFWD